MIDLNNIDANKLTSLEKLTAFYNEGIVFCDKSRLELIEAIQDSIVNSYTIDSMDLDETNFKRLRFANYLHCYFNVEEKRLSFCHENHVTIPLCTLETRVFKTLKSFQEAFRWTEIKWDTSTPDLSLLKDSSNFENYLRRKILSGRDKTCKLLLSTCELTEEEMLSKLESGILPTEFFPKDVVLKFCRKKLSNQNFLRDNVSGLEIPTSHENLRNYFEEVWADRFLRPTGLDYPAIKESNNIQAYSLEETASVLTRILDKSTEFLSYANSEVERKGTFNLMVEMDGFGYSLDYKNHYGPLLELLKIGNRVVRKSFYEIGRENKLSEGRTLLSLDDIRELFKEDSDCRLALLKFFREAARNEELGFLPLTECLFSNALVYQLLEVVGFVDFKYLLLKDNFDAEEYALYYQREGGFTERIKPTVRSPLTYPSGEWLAISEGMKILLDMNYPNILFNEDDRYIRDALLGMIKLGALEVYDNKLQMLERTKEL